MEKMYGFINWIDLFSNGKIFGFGTVYNKYCNMTIITTSIAADSKCCAFAPKRVLFPETIKLHIKGFFHEQTKNLCRMCHCEVKCRKALCGCNCVRHCGLIANGRSQENRDFSCVRNMNWCFTCFTRCAAIKRKINTFILSALF